MNMKKIKKSVKKSTKNNYRIEALEPRLMMDAASGFEVEKLETYVDQFISASENIGSDITSAIDNIVDFNASSLGIADGVSTFSSLLEDSVGDETIVINDVGNATESTRNNFKLDHYTFEFNLKFTKEVDFDLNLARSLGDGFANVATYGNVSAGWYVAEDSGETVKSVNKDLIINPQKNFEIQQSAPLSAADIQALLSIALENLGGSGNTKV